MLRQRPFLVEILTAVGLIAAPFILPYLGFTPTTINRILVWGLFGIGFDILFGFTGLLSFGQSAFFGTGGMVAAYLLTIVNFPYVMAAVAIGTIVAGVVGYLVGLIALRRTGIYFAMITVAIAEVFYFVEFNPLSAWTGGENGLPGPAAGRPPPGLASDSLAEDRAADPHEADRGSTIDCVFSPGISGRGETHRAVVVDDAQRGRRLPSQARRGCGVEQRQRKGIVGVIIVATLRGEWRDLNARRKAHVEQLGRQRLDVANDAGGFRQSGSV